MHKLDTTSGHLPYYKQIKEFYKKDILDGVLAVGDRVDSEMEIQEMYDVSRITARQARTGRYGKAWTWQGYVCDIQA